ncbi:MAG: SGNH/GDSL hydrolase family protein [Rhizobacter sp.]|nr:SGNH/GDSL hydrolase family protein [Burkholderiales bacterium]
MNKIFSLVCLLLTLTCIAPVAAQTAAPEAPPAPNSDDALKVLFVGNSYTYYNNLSAIVAAFAAAAPSAKQLLPKDHTMGGATLEKIWDLRTTRDVLALKKWDFVVLQEHSYWPISSPERMFDAARKFDLAGKAIGAKTVLFLTWARQASPNEQPLLNAAYESSATRLGALIAPVGPAWQIALALDPKLSLYAFDGRHPSATGSYIAACTLFLVISGSQQPCPPLALAAVSTDHASIGRTAALQAVTTWRKL